MTSAEWDAAEKVAPLTPPPPTEEEIEAAERADPEIETPNQLERGHRRSRRRVNAEREAEVAAKRENAANWRARLEPSRRVCAGMDERNRRKKSRDGETANNTRGGYTVRRNNK
jgi:hypothetical protein